MTAHEWEDFTENNQSGCHISKDACIWMDNAFVYKVGSGDPTAMGFWQAGYQDLYFIEQVEGKG